MAETNRWGSYHEGELAVQSRAGVGRKGLKAGQMYHAATPAGVRKFHPLQQLAILATIDGEGRLWASLRSGQPGFLQVIDDQTLQIGGYAIRTILFWSISRFMMPWEYLSSTLPSAIDYD